MMPAAFRNVPFRNQRYPVETGLLLALCFFLPLLEAPKNILWVGYVVCWIVNRARARTWGGRWDLWDTLIAAWIASGFLVAAFAGLHGNEWRGTLDIVKYGAVLWLLKRGGYGAAEIRMVLGMLVASTVVGLGVGHWRMLSGAAKSGTLQLWSVGHVNHTAVYLAIMLALCAAWLFARWRTWRAGTKAVGLAVTAFVLASLVITASRGAVGVGLITLLILSVAWWRRSRAPLVLSLASILILAAAALGMGFDVVRKHQEDVAAQNMLAFRDSIWRMGLVAWERYPWFGVGLDNYQLITHERVKEWRAAAGKDYDAARYVHFPHAHNLLINTLAERGLVGTAALFAVLLAWLAWLLRFRPRAQDEDLEWILWGAATGAWLVTVGAGAVNTTLHDEHGILAALLLGLWLSRHPPARAS
jgi:O-antigen ligase